MGIEFYIFDDDLWYTDGERSKKITEKDTNLIGALLEMISTRYPEAYGALEKEYSRSSANIPYYQYLIVRRFCKCNFGKLDCKRMDIEADGTFNFDKLDCPLRGECHLEGVVCSPKFNARLSTQELRVMRLVYEGREKEEISRELFISPHTVKNHIKAVYTKLGIHDKATFLRYAAKNRLFD